MNLELTMLGKDNTVLLTYWDSFHGLDKVFILRRDGTAHRADPDGTHTEINLALALRELYQGVDGGG